jgi:fumarate reductase subunit D
MDRGSMTDPVEMTAHERREHGMHMTEFAVIVLAALCAGAAVVVAVL